MFSPYRKTPPTGELISLADMKAAINVLEADDDVLIEALLQSAVDHFDGYMGVLGRCLVNQVWISPFDEFKPSQFILLPFPDVSAVTVLYDDTTGAEQTLTTSNYSFGSAHGGGFVQFKKSTLPTLQVDNPSPVRIEFTAGFGDANAVPEGIKTAIKLLVCHWFENRGDNEVGLPQAIDALTRQYRMPRI